MSSSTKKLSKLHKEVDKNKTNNKVLAFQLYTQLIENDPYDGANLNDFSMFCMSSNLTEQAIEFYNKILEKHPKHYLIVNLLGACYLSMNNYVKAIEYFKKVLTIKNDIPQVYNNIGICYDKMRDYRNSENCYKISLNLYNLNSFKDLGDVYFYKKEYDKSIDNYTKYITFVEQEDIELSKVKYNLSFPYLAKNDFIKGFELYENRLKDNSPNIQTKQIQRVEIDFLEY
jgi:tetratricopeptide (TPR) repeat protein